jgi:hypothetical protein
LERDSRRRGYPKVGKIAKLGGPEKGSRWGLKGLEGLGGVLFPWELSQQFWGGGRVKRGNLLSPEISVGSPFLPIELNSRGKVAEVAPFNSYSPSPLLSIPLFLF